MKRFIEIIMPIKTNAAFSFTITTILYTLWMWFAGGDIPVRMVFSFLLISLLCSCLQALAFTQLVFKVLPYSIRLIIFMVPLFASIAGISVLFRWFPAHLPFVWLTFAIIFFAIFILLTIGFEICFRITGNRYDGLLNEYQARKKTAPPEK